MESYIQVHSHIGADGTLHIEGLHQMADQDVMIILSSVFDNNGTPSFELQRYAAPIIGKPVADRLKAISKVCANLPVLDDRSPDEILGYNDIGLPQ
ncbi:MAG: hypothetical protein AAFV72_08475 [Cyanobacteria bacterium J06635_1]